MTPSIAPWGLPKSILFSPGNVSDPGTNSVYNGLLCVITSQPGLDRLQAIQDGPIVAACHLDAKDGGDEAEVQPPEVRLFVPWGTVET